MKPTAERALAGLAPSGRYLQRWAPYMILNGILAVLLAGAVTSVDRWYGDRSEARERRELVAAPSAEWFTYQSVEFVEVADDGALVFASTRVIAVPVNMAFFDQLLCESDDGVMIPRSTKSWDAAPKDPHPLETKEWFYTGVYPADGTACMLRSTVTAERGGIAKSQTVESPRFVPVPIE